MHLLTESSLLNPISTCFRNSAYCANVNNCGCSEHHITPDPYDSSFSMHCQKAYIKVHQKTNWRTQPLDIIWFHEFFWQMKINFSNKKKNNSDLQVSSWKVFYQNHMLFVFFSSVTWITNSLCQNLIQVFDQAQQKKQFPYFAVHQ